MAFCIGGTFALANAVEAKNIDVDRRQWIARVDLSYLKSFYWFSVGVWGRKHISDGTLGRWRVFFCCIPYGWLLIQSMVIVMIVVGVAVLPNSHTRSRVMIHWGFCCYFEAWRCRARGTRLERKIDDAANASTVVVCVKGYYAYKPTLSLLFPTRLFGT